MSVSTRLISTRFIMYYQLDPQLDSHLGEIYDASSYSTHAHLDDEMYARRDTSYVTLAQRHHV